MNRPTFTFEQGEYLMKFANQRKLVNIEEDSNQLTFFKHPLKINEHTVYWTNGFSEIKAKLIANNTIQGSFKREDHDKLFDILICPRQSDQKYKLLSWFI